MFAKIFETEEYGQILVKVDKDQEGNPSVQLFFRFEGEDVSTLEESFRGSDAADAAFEEYDEAKAIEHVSFVRVLQSSERTDN